MFHLLASAFLWVSITSTVICMRGTRVNAMQRCSERYSTRSLPNSFLIFRLLPGCQNWMERIQTTSQSVLQPMCIVCMLIRCLQSTVTEIMKLRMNSKTRGLHYLLRIRLSTEIDHSGNCASSALCRVLAPVYSRSISSRGRVGESRASGHG